MSLLDLPTNLPEPEDDGAASHLEGIKLPRLKLAATSGVDVDLSELQRACVFLYPRTGVPGRSPGQSWDLIPGARGCTPQACGFRDVADEFAQHDVQVFGLSTQTIEFQSEFVRRHSLPFALLSDAQLKLVNALRLPVFEFDIDAVGGGGPHILMKRMAWLIERGRIKKCWYPVFPPDQCAVNVLQWITRNSK